MKTFIKRFSFLFIAAVLFLIPLGTHAATKLTADNFDAARYASDYADLMAAFGTDSAKLFEHYVSYGSGEGRTAYTKSGDTGYIETAVTLANFDYKTYADKYADLKAAFGYDSQALYNHYITYGIKEGRSVTTASSSSGTGTGAQSTSSSSSQVTLENFDYKAYADKYADLKAAFGYDSQALYNHYITYGIKEGRTVSAANSTAQQSTSNQNAAIVHSNVVSNTISILGDSISTYAGTLPSGFANYYDESSGIALGGMWWMQLATVRGYSLMVNGSWSRSTVTGESYPSGGCSWNRINALSSDGVSAPAIIFVMMGTNDYLRKVGIGSHNAGESFSSSWSFSEAYDMMLIRLRASYPNTRIICLTCPPISYYPEGMVNSIGDYNTKIMQLAAAYGIQVIDTSQCGITGNDLLDG